MDDTLDSLKLLKGCYVAKISFLIKDGLTLYLKKNEQDEFFSTKIFFNGILGFHDTGFVTSKFDYVDIGPLGFKYMSYSRTHSLDTNEFNQIVFISDNNGVKAELIVACKSVAIMQS